MKKGYLKPDAEFIKFVLEDVITAPIEGTPGLSDIPEDW